MSLELGEPIRAWTRSACSTSGVQGTHYVAQLDSRCTVRCLLINGHERDFLMASSKATFDAIATLPAFYGARHGAGTSGDGRIILAAAEWANVASNWLRWQLKSDKQAAKMFVGTDCSLSRTETGIPSVEAAAVVPPSTMRGPSTGCCCVG
jgi:hypothetical protein